MNFGFGRGMTDAQRKISILVDKVMQPQANWRTKEWMIKETAEAGFSVFSPRNGHDDLDEVRQVTEWCEKYGLLHMPWMMGTLKATGRDSEGRRLTWADGLEQTIWSPNSPEFWEWTAKYVVEYSRISRKSPSLIGVFLDYENYAPGKPRRDGNCYSISYDEEILSDFAGNLGIDLPHLEPSQRAAWLEKRGVKKAFENFQVRHWRRQCRSLREQVDGYNPEFLFCIYPAPGTLFMREACYNEWSTERAPILLADAASYGRYSRFATQDEALLENRRKLVDRMEIPRKAGIPFTYIGGIDPVVIGADPEFCGKNALSIGQITGGYWVFYEGPDYGGNHPDYFKWFGWANSSMEDGRMDAWREPRSTPDEWGIALGKDGSSRAVALAPTRVSRYESVSPVEMLFESTLFLGPKTGQRIQVRVLTRPFTGGEGTLSWEAKDPTKVQLGKGHFTVPGENTITFTARKGGTHLIYIDSEEYSYSIIYCNAPFGLYAGRSVTFRDGSGLLHFGVQKGLDEFTFIVRGSRNWEGTLNIFDPSGKLESQSESPELKKKIRVNSRVNGRPGIWSLEVTKEDEDPMGYVSIQFLSPPTLLPLLSLRPEHVFSRG